MPYLNAFLDFGYIQTFVIHKMTMQWYESWLMLLALRIYLHYIIY